MNIIILHSLCVSGEVLRQDRRQGVGGGLWRSDWGGEINVTHSYGWKLKEASVPHPIDFSVSRRLECPRDMVTGFHQTEAPKGEEGRSPNAF